MLWLMQKLITHPNHTKRTHTHTQGHSPTYHCLTVGFLTKTLEIKLFTFDSQPALKLINSPSVCVRIALSENTETWEEKKHLFIAPRHTFMSEKRPPRLTRAVVGPGQVQDPEQRLSFCPSETCGANISTSGYLSEPLWRPVHPENHLSAENPAD